MNVPVLGSLVNASLSLADNWSKMSALEQAKTVFTLVVQGGRQLNLLPPPAAHTAISAGSAVLVGADGAGQAPNNRLTLSYHRQQNPSSNAYEFKDLHMEFKRPGKYRLTYVVDRYSKIV